MSDTTAADQTTATGQRHVVTFTLGREEYAVDIARTKEIILVGDITRVPQMPDYLRGVINLRGSVIPVVDLRLAFGLDGRPYDEQSRIIISRLDDRIVGLVVDAVSQVMKIPESAIEPPPTTIAALVGSYLVGVAKVNERMILLLAIDRLLTAAQNGDLTTVLTHSDSDAAATA